MLTQNYERSRFSCLLSSSQYQIGLRMISKATGMVTSLE